MENASRTGNLVAQNIPDSLAGLIEAGLTECEITRMARLRGTYARMKEAYPGVAHVEDIQLSTNNFSRLNFVRWLYQSGRLKD